MMKPFAERTHEKMKEVLMNHDATGPEIHYYMMRGGSDKENITVWESGTVGGEYIKTYGHYHVGKLDETYRVLRGEGLILLQKRRQDADNTPIDDEIESFRVIKVKAGDSVFIESGWGHLGVNIGRTWFVTSDDSPVDFGEKEAVSLPGHADYEPVKKLHGFAYYVVEKNGKSDFVKNPRYKVIPEITFE